MKRRSTAGSRSAKGHGAFGPKARKASTAPVSAGHSAEEFDRLRREHDETLEQQAATSEVLRVISRSPTDVQPVFDMIAESAARLCKAQFCFVDRFDGQLLHFVAHRSLPPDVLEINRRAFPAPPNRGSASARAILERNVVQIPDVSADPDYALGAMAAVGGYRSVAAVPILRDGVPIGSIAVTRAQVGLLPNRQIELLKTFADQAVIAIENTRLFEAEQQRTRELSEALEQQTAASEVLSIISSSPGELEPVFRSMLANAVRICEGKFGTLYLREADGFRTVATHNAPPAYIEARMREALLRPPPDVPLGRVAATKQVVQIADIKKTQSYIEQNPFIVTAVELGGYRTVLAVPMLKDNELIGSININRQEVRPFTDKQIELVTNFAAQAVIAIENTRLLKELRESLQQQIATADVLKVISRSAFDLQTVLDALIESAARLCEADVASINRAEGDAFQMIASFGYSPEYKAYMDAHLVPAGRGSVTGRTVLEGGIIHIPDVLADPDFKFTGGAQAGGVRTMLGVPLLREGTPIGVINLQRKAVRPFTDKQIELVTTFADQAVIAIENSRLLSELRERTNELAQRQAELSVTFDNMGDGVAMFDDKLRLAAWNRNLQEILSIPDSFFTEPQTHRDYATYLIQRGEFGNVDLEAELQRYVESAGQQWRIERTRPDGRVLEVRHNPVPGGGFVLIYSDITERKRSEEEIRAARDTAEATLRDLRTTQDRLVQTQKLASLGQLTAGIAHEIKNPLNFVNNFSGVSVEMIDELQDVLGRISIDHKARAEISELTNTLRGNLEKVMQHGKRADAIVKNMLLHSREGSGEHRLVDINALVEESLNLAYHGARAEKQGFNISLERSLDPAAGEADVFPQDITRVLLNLISNGFYAATKRKDLANSSAHEPTLTAATRNLGDSVEIRIRDNGTGIPPEVKDKMFNPFFTTKPAGEGTGLGLSISHDIIVKQHAGSIEVDTQPGEYTEFRIILPRNAAFLAKSGGRA